VLDAIEKVVELFEEVADLMMVKMTLATHVALEMML